MTIAMLEERPPYVECFIDSVEDRAATIEQGKYVGKDVVFFKVIPAGGKLEVILNAEEHLRNLRKRGDQFLRMFEDAHKAFIAGEEAPVSGTPIRDWPAISASQVKMLLSINVRTVEDLATLPEDGLQRIGMGARALQQKAMAWLQSAEGPGKMAERLAALETALGDMKTENARKDAEIAELRVKLEVKEGPRERTRSPRKDDAA